MKRILIADDDSDLRILVVEALSAFGYEVDDVENGMRAWKALHIKAYDLLITDHEMPEMTGLQLVDKVRTARLELPIIVASGSMLPELLARNVWMETVSMLAKPFTVDELRRAVERLLPADMPAVTT